MKHHIWGWRAVIGLITLGLVSGRTVAQPAADPDTVMQVASPNGEVEVHVMLDADGRPGSAIHLNRQPLQEPSRLGLATPQDRMHTAEVWDGEFQRLQEMEVRGVNVDFFGGDKQSVIQLYRCLFRDAGEHDLLVNIHGSTLPRSWHRTFRQLMTSKAVQGCECIIVGQEDPDRVPTHATAPPFMHNVVGPMDFTPTILTDSVGASKWRTSDAFDLAMTVVFESGTHHLGVYAEKSGASASVRAGIPFSGPGGLGRGPVSRWISLRRHVVRRWVQWRGGGPDGTNSNVLSERDGEWHTHYRQG